MTKDIQKKESLLKAGKVFAHWSFPEYIKYQHSKGWYFGFTILTLGLLIFSLFTLNFLFAVIIIISAIIIFFHDVKEPMKVEFYIGEGGIVLERKFFDYKEFDFFWLIYESKSVKNLYFEFKSSIKSRLSIPLEDQDPIKIREFLLQYIEEDLEKEEEPAFERLGRALKI
jgi:hypothetical protein